MTPVTITLDGLKQAGARPSALAWLKQLFGDSAPLADVEAAALKTSDWGWLSWLANSYSGLPLADRERLAMYGDGVRGKGSYCGF